MALGKPKRCMISCSIMSLCVDDATLHIGVDLHCEMPRAVTSSLEGTLKGWLRKLWDCTFCNGSWKTPAMWALQVWWGDQVHKN